jgi:glycosyltransferase involved in cell wall biosynthesis
MNDDDTPLISIAMPIRNNASTIDLAVRSIQAQTFRDWELILIDDGSTDATPERCRRLAAADARIKFLDDRQARGLPDRLNQAIALARGRFFARMDGDDVAYPERLERQLVYLADHPGVDLLGCHVIVFGDDGVPLGKRACAETHKAICARPSAGFALVHPAFFGHLEFFRKYGYRSGAVRCEDQDLLLRSYGTPEKPRPGGMLKSQDQDLLVRSFQAARFANVPEILLGYRESRLDWRKNLVSRRYLAQSFFENHWHDGHPGLAVRAVAGQAVKSLVDLVAISTGLNYRILRHRARPIDETDRHRWDEVWTSLNVATVAALAVSPASVSSSPSPSPSSSSSASAPFPAGDSQCLAC